jgi:glucokinase
MILAGDIGGTKTRLALFESKGEEYKPTQEQDFHSSQHASLEEIVIQYLSKSGAKPRAACFGFAGVAKNGQAIATNLPWSVNADQLSEKLGTEHVWLINDLEANAYGLAALETNDFCTINPGVEGETGNAGLISAGTGLGEAGLFWDGEEYRPFSSEGGHCDFAVKNEQEFQLFQYLQGRYGSVSWERVISGTGLFNIYSFLRDSGYGTDPDWMAAEIVQGDSAAAISRNALQHKSELCDLALNMFVSFYGAEAGNLALKLMAIGGIYLGGGIAPKIVERLREPIFMEAFCMKGRFRNVLKNIPVKVILNDKTALLGAARYAYRQCKLVKKSRVRAKSA